MENYLDFTTERKAPTSLEFRTSIPPRYLDFSTEASPKAYLDFRTALSVTVLDFKTIRKLEAVALEAVTTEDCGTTTVTLPILEEVVEYIVEVDNLSDNSKVASSLNTLAGTVTFYTDEDGIYSILLFADGEPMTYSIIPVLCRSKKCAAKANLKDVRHLEKCNNKYSSRLVDLFIRGIEANAATNNISAAFELLSAVNDICSDNCEKCSC